MKKKRLASLLIVAPLALLAACSSTPSIELNHNWFSNTGRRDIPDDFEETLEYAVTFEKSTSAQKSSFSMDLPNGGTYKTTFRSGSVDGQKTYVYTTELKTEIQFTLNGVSTGLMENTVTTRVEFLDATKSLKPISSTRTEHTDVPVFTPVGKPASLEAAYKHFDCKTEIVYNHENEKATSTRNYFDSDGNVTETENREVKLKVNGFYFDNEQIFPMLRALDLSASMPIYTIDPTTNSTSLDKIAVKDGPNNLDSWKQSVKYSGDTEAVERSYNVTTIGMIYNKKNSGGVHTFTLARRDSAERNFSRNVILEYTYPAINSHGTMTYKLVAANFYNN